ncbi:MAG: histidinol-phosphate aminotransferase family protein [Gemmatimonadaceae bacterium]|nr:histidinol-phosphate aminotransferase family protein [Gemmatimonadaceae bacterium]
MPVSRRYFVSALGLGGAGLLSPPLFGGRGHEARLAEWFTTPQRTPQKSGLIRLDSNENPNGPGAKAFEAIRAMFGEANRYPDAPEDALIAAIAKEHGVAEENVILGCGSSEILRMCVEALVSTAQHLVTASPTFELPETFARTMGRPVVSVPVDAKLRLDLDAMGNKAGGAGLVFFCNPNNPTATVYGDAEVREFVTRVRRDSPATYILIDEAYHEYVDDATYKSAVPMAVADPYVIVSRTFSKVFGMAGLRAGYAIVHRDTARKLRGWRLGSGVNVLALAAATASISDREHIALEQRRNREAKAFTRAFFEKAGYDVGVSETNFLMIDLRRDMRPVREACRREGVAVGRPFPPLTNWLRVSIGTMDEMQRATEVFRKVL